MGLREMGLRLCYGTGTVDKKLRCIIDSFASCHLLYIDQPYDNSQCTMYIYIRCLKTTIYITGICSKFYLLQLSSATSECCAVCIRETEKKRTDLLQECETRGKTLSHSIAAFYYSMGWESQKWDLEKKQVCVKMQRQNVYLLPQERKKQEVGCGMNSRIVTGCPAESCHKVYLLGTVRLLARILSLTEQERPQKRWRR